MHKKYLLILISFILAFASAMHSLACNKGKNEEIANFYNIETAIKMYFLDMKEVPTTEEGLIALNQPIKDKKYLSKYPADGYLRVLPTDEYGNKYEYELLSTREIYSIVIKSPISGKTHKFHIERE